MPKDEHEPRAFDPDALARLSSTGREDDLLALAAAWQEALEGRPHAVVLRADTGIGKTRLVQDFFRLLSNEEDPEDYWSGTLSDQHKAMSIVPEPTESSSAEMRFFWTAVRCRNPAERNSDGRPDVAIDALRRQFETHLFGLYQARARRSANTALAKATLSTLATFAIPGVPQAVSALQEAAGTGLTTWDQFRALIDRGRIEQTAQSARAQAVEREFASSADATISAFQAVAESRERAAPSVPIVFVVDDAQWADPTTLRVLLALWDAAHANQWRMLTIVTAWDETLRIQERGDDGLAATLAATELPVRQHDLHPLREKWLRTIVRQHLPSIGAPCERLLARRCSGDVDLLMDFVSELLQDPGWLDADGSLAVALSEVETLPSTARGMAQRRLRTVGGQLATTLSLASVQGIEFFTALAEGAHSASDADEERSRQLREALDELDNQHGVLHQRPHATLEAVNEFRRHIYWELSLEALRRRPGEYDQALAGLAMQLRDLFATESWRALSPREHALLGERYLTAIEELRLEGPGWSVATETVRSYLAAARLELGDMETAERLAGDILRSDAGPDARQVAHRVLVDAAYSAGNLALEQLRLDAWRSDPEAGSAERRLREAGLHLRAGDPQGAVAIAESVAQDAAEDATRSYEAKTLLSHAYWAAGRPDESLTVLASIEAAWHPHFRRVDVDHVAALAQHDLERSLRVLDHAQRCVDAYAQAGRVEAELISTVNVGDAQWALGMTWQAERTLRGALTDAKAAVLPHAEDIAALCLANVFAEQRDIDSALPLYRTGIDLAVRIGHDWDELYGRMYGWLAVRETAGCSKDFGEMPDLRRRAEMAGYHYLAELGLAIETIAAHVTGQPVDELLDEWDPAAALGFPGPAAHVLAVKTLNQGVTPASQRALLHVVGRCQGIKGRRSIIIEALGRVSQEGSLTEVDAAFVKRWIRQYSPEQVISPAAEPRLTPCHHRTCEARCCYDGVYLEPGDAERIDQARAALPAVFADVPENALTEGSWHGTTGPKTRTRPHQYSAPDYPEHFEQTRCVFAHADGACSLQVAADKLRLHPWTFKPRSCWMHPLRIQNGKPDAPAARGERDEMYASVLYPGYASSTLCGEDAPGGVRWDHALREEINEFRQGR